MKLGLVLGGGGLVGLGYHAGVMKALDEHGIDATTADLTVGTSAGSIVAAYLLAGWPQTDFYEFAHGRHPGATAEPAEQREEVRELFRPLWSSPAERARRWVGSAFAMASSRGLLLKRKPPAALRRAFPAGMYSSAETRLRFHDDLPQEWPAGDLFVCAADLYTGERVVFGAPGAPGAPLPDAVAASTAIPGVFPAVAIAGRHYVDGGVVSATSLDLAADAGCNHILCVAPLGYRKDGPLPIRDPRRWGPVLFRSAFARALRREVRAARAGGVHVLVVRPYLSDLDQHGTNSMRHYDRVAVVEGARRGVGRLLESVPADPVAEAFQKARRERAG